MKRPISALLSLTLLAGGAAACSSSSSEGGGSLTITTWSLEATGWKDWWPALAAEFEQAHPGTTVEVEQIAFADYVNSLTTRFVAGEAPELIHIPLPLTTMPAWAEAGFLADIGEFLQTTDIPGAWSGNQSAMEWDGTSYGVLMQDYGYVLFYNQAMLDAAGVAVPTTIEEMLTVAQATTGDGKYGYSITADNTVNFLRDLFMFPSGEGAKWIDGSEWNLTDPDVVAAVDAWRTLARQYAPQGTDINQKRQAFFDGNVAMMIEGPFILGQIAANSPADVAPNLHVAQLPFPYPPGDLSNGIAIAEGLDDETRELAEEFIRLLSSSEKLEALASAVTSPVARISANSVLAVSPDTEQIVEAAQNKAELVFPASAAGLREDFASFQELAVDELHRLLNSDAPTADVLADLQSKLKDEGVKP